MNAYVHGYTPRETQRLQEQSGILEELLHSDTCYSAGHKVLEAGCGVGGQTVILTRRSPETEFISIDISPESLSQAQVELEGITNVCFRQANITELPFDDESFDVVIELDVIHHVQDLGTTLAEIYRVLKPGGHFLVFEPNICNPLMFFAHALPIEERLALGRNRPTKLISLLEERFTTINWTGICEL
ncbi:MAG: methyltransferase domain-containing protein, partial [Chloroflexi bacterium]|nr:methyltransferase domain-containing protein [Chloroflexota bacterium]